MAAERQILTSKRMNNRFTPEIICIGNVMPSGHAAGKVYDSDGISPTVMENHGYPPMIIEYERD